MGKGKAQPRCIRKLSVGCAQCFCLSELLLRYFLLFFFAHRRQPETGIISSSCVQMSSSRSHGPGSGLRYYLCPHNRTGVCSVPSLGRPLSMNLQSGLSGGTPIQHMDHLSEAPPDDPNVFLFQSSPIRRPDSRGAARRQNINDFSTCGQRCIVSAADGGSCDACVWDRTTIICSTV